jgi:hypothetical protein
MKKFLLLIGVGIGFVAGSKAGTGPYKRLEGTIRELSRRPEVKRSIDAASDKVSEKVEEVQDTISSKVNSKLSSVSH